MICHRLRVVHGNEVKINHADKADGDSDGGQPQVGEEFLQ